MSRLVAAVIGKNLVIEYESHEAAMAAIEGPLCFVAAHHAPSELPALDAASRMLFDLSRYARHRPGCPEANGPGDCNCGLYALHDSILCRCGHKISVHTDRDVNDVVGWPCSQCKSARCTGFRLAAPEGEPTP